ncbi:hypothetical protein Vadar_018358 [Vaccinium darrowii]|nr:hypothetical protein Vadar_018358 [Vaccinium darrowii]
MAEQNSSADWLPPGWTVEVRKRKNGKRDTCYSDPSNKLKFFSKPEVLRYLNNTESNRYKSNGKRKGSRSRKLSAINSPGVAEELSLADNRPNEPMTTNQNSKVVGVLKEDQTFETCTGGERTSMICFNLSKTSDSEKRGKSDHSAVVVADSEKLAENGLENPGNKRLQIQASEKNKREKPDLPRRASKRLAGIEVGPIAELKTNNRTHRVSGRRVDEADASKAENLLDSAAPEKCVDQRASEDDGDDKKADEEGGGSHLNFSLEDLWRDPCIEFAIKTLTDAIPIEDENQVEENPGSYSDLPFGDSWGDPCIDFAVKTLTGAIPVVDEFGMSECLLTSSSETMQDKGSEISNVGLHNSGDAGIQPHCEERSDDLQRKTICG